MARDNQRNAILILTAVTAVFLLAGRLAAGRVGMLVGALLALVVVVAACWFTERLVLRMAQAREATEQEQPELHHLVQNLAERAGLPAPRLFLIDDPAPNAFAVGRDPSHAVVVVTTGLLDLLDDAEGAAVIAHELSHVEQRDTLVGGVLATVIFAVTLPPQLVLHGFQSLLDAIQGYGGTRNWEDPDYARRHLMLYLSPLIAPLLRLARPGRCEYAADADAARLATSPLLLASALRKIEAAIPLGPSLDADPAMHHLFIANPSPDERIDWLLSTRPSLEERVRRLGAS